MFFFPIITLYNHLNKEKKRWEKKDAMNKANNFFLDVQEITVFEIDVIKSLLSSETSFKKSAQVLGLGEIKNLI